jgi:hypothetical protein
MRFLGQRVLKDLEGRQSHFGADFYLFKYQRAAFRTTAKLTHRIYGKSRKVDTLEILQKASIVSSIAAQSNTISKRAIAIICKPKKMGVQSPFRTN